MSAEQLSEAAKRLDVDSYVNFVHRMSAEQLSEAAKRLDVECDVNFDRYHDVDSDALQEPALKKWQGGEYLIISMGGVDRKWEATGAHDIGGLDEWFSKNNTTDGLFAKDQKYDRSNWEPQFVSHSQIPFHDERFPFQLRDNTVLRWELCRANYTIDVLDDVFMFHRGIKLPNNGKSFKVQKRNSARFDEALKTFKQRMDKEYPETKQRCPTPER
ncbi:hypothetical protein COOONC_01805 [Cooperia oncophora]